MERQNVRRFTHVSYIVEFVYNNHFTAIIQINLC